jgi:hypothetical protein
MSRRDRAVADDEAGAAHLPAHRCSRRCMSRRDGVVADDEAGALSKLAA